MRLVFVQAGSVLEKLSGFVPVWIGSGREMQRKKHRTIGAKEEDGRALRGNTCTGL